MNEINQLKTQIQQLQEQIEQLKDDQFKLVEAAGRQIAQVHQKLIQLTCKPKTNREDYTGWWVIKECKDGSLILQSDTGERRHIWQGGPEKLIKENDLLKTKIQELEERIQELESGQQP